MYSVHTAWNAGRYPMALCMASRKKEVLDALCGPQIGHLLAGFSVGPDPCYMHVTSFLDSDCVMLTARYSCPLP
jgi:hypothetical protein